MARWCHPSLRTGRADFPHPALRSMGSRRERARSSRGLQGRFPFDSITQVICAWLIPLRHSPRGHSQRLVCCRSAQLPSIFLHSLRSTIIARFIATMGALTSSWAALRPPRGMNPSTPKPISLIPVSGLPAILSPTICGVSEGRGGLLRTALRMPEGFALCDRLRTALAGSPISTDRIEFTLFVLTDERRYGLAVLVPLLSTPCFHDAVTVRYRTILHRTETDSHRFDQTPSQAHERGIYAASTWDWRRRWKIAVRVGLRGLKRRERRAPLLHKILCYVNRLETSQFLLKIHDFL